MKLSLVVSIAAIMSITGVSAQDILAEGTYDANCHEYALYGNRNKNYAAAIAWTAANANGRCEDKKPHLVTITSDGENSFVADMIKDVADNYAWIGGHDTDVQGEFAWITGEAWEYSHWGTDPYQPDNAFGREEDCVQFTSQLNEATGIEDFWNDLDCDYKRPFIVEWDCECPEEPASLTSPSGVRDDHPFKSWTGEMYNFHGICDLVFLHNPEFHNHLGMDIHIRTAQTKSWSYIAAAAIRVGHHTLEVYGGTEETNYWINGVEGAPLSDLAFDVVYERINSQQRKFSISYSKNRQVIIKTFKDFVRVDVMMHGVKQEDFEHSLGLMRSFQNGVKVGRDGMTVFDDFNAFGQEWQVLADESTLFHNLEGPQAPERCMLPKTRSSSLRRRHAEIDISLEEAEIACASVNPAGFDMCVFDVIATNDKELAGTYLS